MLYQLVFCSLLLSSFCFGRPCYEVRDLDIELGVGKSEVTSINNRGQVLGRILVEGNYKTFIWTPGEGKRFIEKIPAGAYPSQLNDRGEVVGQHYVLEGWATQYWRLHSFIWSEEEGLTDISPTDGRDTSGYRINEAGKALLVKTGGGLCLWEENAYTRIEGAESVVWREDLNVLCACLNEEECVYVKPDWRNKRAPMGIYALNLRTRETVPLLEHKREVPYVTCMNGRGVLGGFFLDHDRCEGFFLRRNGQMTKVAHFMPQALNDKEMAVGVMHDFQGSVRKGGLYAEGSLYNIEDLVLPDGEVIYDEVSTLVDVNESGWVIGQGSYMGQQKGLLFVPVQQPEEKN